METHGGAGQHCEIWKVEPPRSTGTGRHKCIVKVAVASDCNTKAWTNSCTNNDCKGCQECQQTAAQKASLSSSRKMLARDLTSRPQSSGECTCRDGTQGETVDIKNVPSTAAVIAYKASKFNDAHLGDHSIQMNLLSWYNDAKLKGDASLPTHLVSQIANDKDQSNSETLFWNLKVPRPLTQEEKEKTKANELLAKADEANMDLEEFLAATAAPENNELGAGDGWWGRRRRQQRRVHSPPEFEDSQGITSCYAMASFQVFDFDGTTTPFVLGDRDPPAKVKLIAVKLALCKKSEASDEPMCSVHKAAVSCFYEVVNEQGQRKWEDCSEGDGEGALVAAFMARP